MLIAAKTARTEFVRLSSAARLISEPHAHLFAGRALTDLATVTKIAINWFASVVRGEICAGLATKLSCSNSSH